MAVAISQFSFPVGDYYFSQPWTLDGITYLLTLRFNTRMGTWMLDLADATGLPVVSGVVLRAGRNLLSAYKARDVPPGAFFVYDSTGADADPGPDSFSTTHSLCYGTIN